MVAPADRLGVIEAVLAAGALSFGDFEIPGSLQRRFEALYDVEPDAARLAAALGGLPVTVVALADRDWVSESQRLNAPIRAGRFYVRASHHPPHPAPGLHDLIVNAGRAFGTGRHETTLGCLLALDRLARRWRVRRALDLGCGSGILALAMARAWRVPVLASDVDPDAVAVAGANVRLNRLSHLVRAVRADGLNHPAIRRGAPYDLITANILVRPLVALAPALGRALAPGGAAVLSGLLAGQQAVVGAACRAQGLRLDRHIALAGWHTLILVR